MNSTRLSNTTPKNFILTETLNSVEMPCYKVFDTLIKLLEYYLNKPEVEIYQIQNTQVNMEYIILLIFAFMILVITHSQYVMNKNSR